MSEVSGGSGRGGQVGQSVHPGSGDQGGDKFHGGTPVMDVCERWLILDLIYSKHHSIDAIYEIAAAYAARFATEALHGAISNQGSSDGLGTYTQPSRRTDNSRSLTVV